MVLLTGAFAALLAAGACLPDLATVTPADASFETSVGPFQGCGDGVIATLDDGGDAGESCDPGSDAEVLGCGECAVTCSEGQPDPATGHCYFVTGVDTTYQDALTHCASKRGHVVTLTSQREADFVKSLAADENYWVGLLRNDIVGGAYQAVGNEEPGLPFSGATSATATGPCSGCFVIGAEGGELSLAPEIDAAAGSDARCIAAVGGRWYRVLCNTTTTQRVTLCEREPVGARAQACIGGICFNVAATAGKKSYFVAVSATDPDTAAQTCASLPSGRLVVFASNEEREQVAHEIRVRYPDETSQELWLGLVEDGGAWHWDDDVVAVSGATRPLPWGNAQPATVAGARAYMRLTTTTYDTELSYGDDGSRVPRLYICERKPE